VQGSGSSGITAFSGGRASEALGGRPEGIGKGGGALRSILGRGGQVGQLEPAAGVGAWETDDRQASFVRAGAMPGLLALERTVGSDVSWTVRHGPSRNPKGGGGLGGRGRSGSLGKATCCWRWVKARIISRLAPCRVSQSGHHAPSSQVGEGGAGHGSSTRLYSCAYRERGGESSREQ
jgi:hypothetical protein